jgi:hypothetical protein
LPACAALVVEEELEALWAPFAGVDAEPESAPFSAWPSAAASPDAG